MSKLERDKILKKLKEIETIKTKVAKLRDDLREKVDDLEGILESLNTGIDDFEHGARAFQDGLDQFSQYV